MIGLSLVPGLVRPVPAVVSAQVRSMTLGHRLAPRRRTSPRRPRPRCPGPGNRETTETVQAAYREVAGA
jgi:hypothetical protein